MTVILNLPNKFSMQNLLLDFSDEHNEKVQAALSKLSIPYEPPPKEVYPIEERANQILDQNYEAQTCIIKLIRKLEAYEIAFQDFTTIKNGIVKKLQEYREQHNVFFLRIVSYLPTDVPELKKEELGVKVLTNLPPDEKTIQELRSIADKYMEVSLDLTGYIWDLQVALQNRLLGELFDNKVSIRKPNDPRYKVLDLDNNKGV